MKVDEPEKTMGRRELNGHGFSVQYLTEFTISYF